MITCPTRISGKSHTTIDLMITNIAHIMSATAYNINLSDHLPTLLLYIKTREKKVSVSFRCRDYSEINLKRYGEAIATYDWSFMYRVKDVKFIWDKKFRVFTDLLDTYCPYKTVTVKKGPPVYISKEFIELGHERDCLVKIAHKTKLQIDWLAARRQRQLVNYAVKRAKAIYYKNILVTSKNDSRMFWSKIKELLPEQKSPDINVVTDIESGVDLSGLEACDYI